MAVKTEATLIAEWSATGDLHALTESDWLDGMRSLQAGGALCFPLPTDGSSTSVAVGESWSVLNPWTVAVPTSGKGVDCSTSTGIMTIETGGDGWYACNLFINGSIAGIVQACELAIRAERSATPYMITGARIDEADVMQHLSVRAPGRLDGASPLHFEAGDTIALYGRTGPSGGSRTLTIHSATLMIERKLPSS